MPTCPADGCQAHPAVKQDAGCDGERKHELLCPCGSTLTVCDSCFSVYLGVLMNACKTANKGTHPQTVRDLIARAKSNRYRAIPCPACTTRFMLPTKTPPKGVQRAKTTVSLVSSGSSGTTRSPPGLKKKQQAPRTKVSYKQTVRASSAESAPRTARDDVEIARVAAEIDAARQRRLRKQAIEAGAIAVRDADEAVSKAAQACLLAIGADPVPVKNVSFFQELDPPCDDSGAGSDDDEDPFDSKLREQLRRVSAAMRLLVDAMEHINRAGSRISPDTAPQAPVAALMAVQRQTAKQLRRATQQQ